MKERIKSGGLLLLTLLGILLIGYSLYGLLSQRGADSGGGTQPEIAGQTGAADAGQETDEPDAAQEKTDEPDELPVLLGSDGQPVSEEDIFEPGDNPDIDAAIQKEMNRILDESEFSYRAADGKKQGYAGEHRASFTNQTEVDFDALQLKISLYRVDDPGKYRDGTPIPFDPLEVHPAYTGPLGAGETVPLSFTSETDAYNYFLFSYRYALEE